MRYTIKRFFRLIFGFSRRETNAFLILVPIIVLCMLSAPVYRSLISISDHDFSHEVALLDSLEATLELDRDKPDDKEYFFPFDPNRVSLESLQRLGFSEMVASRIIKYRNRGGEFNRPDDLLKIYDVDSALVMKLMPYIELSQDNIQISAKTIKKVSREPFTKRFDINEADSIQWMNVSGVGPVLSSRIIKFRNILGGFVRFNQLYEVYGLDSAIVEKLRYQAYLSEDFEPYRLSINQLDAENLARHPYLSWQVAKAIVAYRFQHGSFSSVEEIANIQIIDESALGKVKPYLTTSRMK